MINRKLMKKYRKLVVIASVVLVAVIGFAFMPAPKQITVKGSDTMVILAQKWAEIYMKSNANVVVQVTGGGSGTGISALINGSTDICNSCLLYTSPSPRDRTRSRMPSSA